jgi:mycothiol synthase
LSEVPLLRLAESAPWLTHVQVRQSAGFGPGTLDDEGVLLGYAQIDRSGGTASAELVVLPDARRRGIGSVLLATVEADARIPAVSGVGNSAGQELRVWAHGDLAPAQSFAAAKGYQPARELLLLSRPLGDSIGHRANNDHRASSPQRALPDGYRLRKFQTEADGAAWVALNALVFADHPEQGRLTLADLHARQNEPWFNADDFQVIDGPNDELVAFNWMKVDPESPASGEIYAIGVHPEHRRLGIAGYLLDAAIGHLTANGLSQITLYVEGNNEAALATYYTAGFTPTAADIQYAKSPATLSQ